MNDPKFNNVTKIFGSEADIERIGLTKRRQRGGPFAALASQYAEETVSAIEQAGKKLPKVDEVLPGAEGEPQFYLALELRPKHGVPMGELAELNTVQLFATAAAAPDLFERGYHVFRSLEAAQAYAKEPDSAVLDIVPLCIEFNPLLGF